MSHSNSSIDFADVKAVLRAEPFSFSPALRVLFWVILALAAVVFLVGVQGESAQHYWVSFQVNFLFWFGLAAASSCFSAALHICNAQWARPIRRIFEATSVFFLWSVIPLGILYFGKDYLFLWAREEIPGKGVWLRPDFVYLRDILGILCLAFLARCLISRSVGRDVVAIRAGLTGLGEEELKRWFHKRYDRYLRGRVSDGVSEIKKVHDEMSVLSPIIVVVYALVMSLVAFDQVMSVDPHWYSTLFGAFIFMSAVYMAMAWCSIGVSFARELHPVFRAKIERRTLHDLGKLLFGFGIFWAYLFWSHYLTIWYGNIPEETGWVVVRLREPPWHGLAWLIFGCCFIIPFLLGLSRDVKQVPQLLAGTALIALVGLWLQGYLLFAPTIFQDEIALGWWDVPITLGFLSAFLLSVESFLHRVPLVPFGDLYAEG